MMVLYHAPACINSQRLRLALAEHQLSWESRLVNLAVGEQYRPDYLRINEHGTVPTLLIGEQRFTNTHDAIDFLYQHYREGEDQVHYDHALSQEWMQRMAHFDTRLFIYGHLPRGKRKKALASLERKLDKITAHMLKFPELENQYADKANDIDNLVACIQSPSAIEKTAELLQRMFERAEQQLDGSPCLAGSSFCGADAMFLPLLLSLGKLKKRKWLKQYPALRAYLKRAQQRPSYGIAVQRYEKFWFGLKWRLSTWWKLKRGK